MVSTFYKGSDGCVLAFDVTDLESFEALETWRGDVLAKTIPMEQSYPMVVLGNKIDLADRQVRVRTSYMPGAGLSPTHTELVLTLRISQSGNGCILRIIMMQ